LSPLTFSECSVNQFPSKILAFINLFLVKDVNDLGTRNEIESVEHKTCFNPIAQRV
jgi:hypothetical protein